MARMLDLGRSQPLTPNAKLPAELNIGIDRENNCPLPDEFDGYARKSQHGGMPFAVTGLSDQEYATVQRWLEQGGAVEPRQLQPSAREATQIEQWERLLNTPGPRGSLVARWLYEHLFMPICISREANPVTSISWCVRVRPAASRSMRSPRDGRMTIRVPVSATACGPSAT